MAIIDPELAKALDSGLKSPITALVAFRSGADVKSLLERVTGRARGAPIQCVRQNDSWHLVALADPKWVRELIKEPDVESVRARRYSGGHE